MTDDIQCLKYFNSGEFYCASLIDNTIKVYFADSGFYREFKIYNNY